MIKEINALQRVILERFNFIFGPELQELNTATTLFALHTWYEGYTQHAQRARVFHIVHTYFPAQSGDFFTAIIYLTRNQMAYIAGKNTSVIMVPPNVPPISV